MSNKVASTFDVTRRKSIFSPKNSEQSPQQKVRNLSHSKQKPKNLATKQVHISRTLVQTHVKNSPQKSEEQNKNVQKNNIKMVFPTINGISKKKLIISNAPRKGKSLSIANDSAQQKNHAKNVSLLRPQLQITKSKVQTKLSAQRAQGLNDFCQSSYAHQRKKTAERTKIEPWQIFSSESDQTEGLRAFRTNSTKQQFTFNQKTRLSQISKFQIYNVVDVKILSKIETKDQSLQVQFQNQKAFSDFIRFRQLYHQGIDKIQKKFNDINIQKLESFNHQKNVEQFLRKVQLQSHSSSQRQERVFVLGKDVCEAQGETQQNFIKFYQVQRDIRRQLMENSSKHQSRLQSLITCLKGQLGITGDSNQQARQQNREASQTRLVCVLQNLYNESGLVFHSFQRFIDSMSSTIQNLEKSFHNWTKLLYQNKFLIYNCVKKIEKIPQTLFSLFGQNDKESSLDKELTQQKKLKQFLDMKCVSCYQRNQKLKILRLQSQHSIQIIKALQYLMRNPSKSSSFGLK